MSTWFRHSCALFGDSRLIPLHRAFPLEGYALLNWAYEQMTASEGVALSMARIPDYAWTLRVEEKKLRDIIACLVDECGVFVLEGDSLVDPEHRDAVLKTRDVIETKRRGGQASAAKRGTVPQQVPSTCSTDAEQVMKQVLNDKIDRLTDREIDDARLFAKVVAAYPAFRVGDMLKAAEEFGAIGAEGRAEVRTNYDAWLANISREDGKYAPMLDKFFREGRYRIAPPQRMNGAVPATMITDEAYR